MATKLTWLGHASWMIETGDHQILLDPFLTDSPTAPVKPADLNPDFILISHGHFDHVADAEEIAKASGALLIAIYEVAEWFGKQGVENRLGMNIGGSTEQPFGVVKMTPAIHSSSMPDGSYGGEPAGFLLTIAEQKLYFACDTALFSDMSLIGDEGIDLAVLPIGDLFTMGLSDSVEATKLVRPRKVLPTHYNTWPPIEQDAANWAQLVQNDGVGEPVVLLPGESLTI